MQEIRSETRHDGEQGFMLLGAIVLIFLVLLALSIAAPKVAQDLRRDREVEAIHRGNEYVRAIQLYYKKFGHYPGNMDQLEKSNNIRFLRQKYDDPLTGKPDWRLIHVGEAKTTVKGFFGQPLAGIAGGGPTGGLGAASSMVSGQPGSTVGGTSGSATSPTSPTSPTSSSGSGFSLGSGSSSSPGLGTGMGAGSGSSPTSGPGGASTVSSGAGSSGNGSGFGSGIGSQSATTFSGGGAPIVGVGNSKSGTSITDLNEQTTYETWEFLYDPRIEQLKAKAALLGGPASAGNGSGGLGGSNPLGGSSPGGSTLPGSSPGSSPGLSPGSSPGGMSPTPSPPSTTPQ
jgi:type II secretory pathway pseudopilin PulG